MATYADLVRERFGTVAQLAAEDWAVIVWRRRVLERAMLGARPSPRHALRTRLHRPRLLVRHLEGVTPPWGSREAWADDMFDRWAA